ncbi:asparaginase [Rhodobacteraceae bacterium NNCM2]|nr:asparaginase [Coraliihabitans acroporae]
MTPDTILAEIWRGPVLESVHRGTAVVCRADGEVVAAWGDPQRVILPRSSCKMIQALPLIESGAADRAQLSDAHLALACASHNGAQIHTSLARAWLSDLGLSEQDLRCGPQVPADAAARQILRDQKAVADQTHNNCSGKHCGFLTLSKSLGAGSEYIDIDHPVQGAVKQVTAEVAQEELGDFAIDGCSAPNFAMSMRGFATALARFAAPQEAFSDTRAIAATRLRDAMAKHPDLVAGEGRACTKLMRGMANGTVVKTGAEGVFAAILPAQGLGIAVKCDDGATRGAETAITALLGRFGALDPEAPVYKEFADAPILNRRGIAHGHVRAGAALSE